MIEPEFIKQKYAYIGEDEKGKLISRPMREISEHERRENEGIL